MAQLLVEEAVDTTGNRHVLAMLLMVRQMDASDF